MGTRENECQISQKCENTGKMLEILCVRRNFVKFDIHFLGLPEEIFFGFITDDYGHD